MAHQLIMMDGSALFPSATYRKIFGWTSAMVLYVVVAIRWAGKKETAMQ
jgi:hypothetical protein